MNDPGLDAPIKDHAKAVDVDQNERRNEEQLGAEDEQAFLNPRSKLSSMEERSLLTY